MEMICINCPLGCVMDVITDGEEIIVKGNTCNRGKDYAVKEWKHPMRTVTTSLYVEGGVLNLVSVKTKEAFPKEKIFELLSSLKPIVLKAPIDVGDVILSNALGTGVDIIATQKCPARSKE